MVLLFKEMAYKSISSGNATQQWEIKGFGKKITKTTTFTFPQRQVVEFGGWWYFF